MFGKIRKVFVAVAILCLAFAPMAQASPVQYVDELGQSWVRILDFVEDFMASVWSNSESGEPPPPSNNSTENGGEEDDGGDDDDGTPGFGPIVDPIG